MICEAPLSTAASRAGEATISLRSRRAARARACASGRPRVKVARRSRKAWSRASRGEVPGGRVRQRAGSMGAGSGVRDGARVAGTG